MMATGEARQGTGEEAAIDEAHLRRQTGGDTALADELLAMFSEQCAVHLATIGALGSLQERLDAAHTLKGAASAVGAFRVATAAGEAESALKAGESHAKPTLSNLTDAIAEARATIARRA